MCICFFFYIYIYTPSNYILPCFLPGPKTKLNMKTTTKKTIHNPKAKLYMNVFVCIIKKTKKNKKKTKNEYYKDKNFKINRLHTKFKEKKKSKKISFSVLFESFSF